MGSFVRRFRSGFLRLIGRRRSSSRPSQLEEIEMSLRFRRRRGGAGNVLVEILDEFELRFELLEALISTFSRTELEKDLLVAFDDDDESRVADSVRA